MSHIPADCTVCPYERTCDTAMFYSDCIYYEIRNSKVSLFARIKKLIGKVFH